MTREATDLRQQFVKSARKTQVHGGASRYVSLATLLVDAGD
jgi:hypothetical protein